jgi:TonB family protein
MVIRMLPGKMEHAPMREQGEIAARALYPPATYGAIFLRIMRYSPLLPALALLAGAACPSPDSTQKAMDAMTSINAPPDQLPVMENQELPFHYPDRLYSAKVQANVILGIFIDSTGMVWPESTRVLTSSGYASLDSAAVRGAPELHFRPAMTKGKPVPVLIRLPVFFRYPGAPPLPGDTALAPKAAPAPAP